MIFDRIMFILFSLSLAGCEVMGEIPLPSSEQVQGVPEVDPEIWVSSTGLDTTEVRPRVEIPSSVTPIGKKFIDYFSGEARKGRLANGAG